MDAIKGEDSVLDDTAEENTEDNENFTHYSVNYTPPRPYSYASDYHNNADSRLIPKRHLLVWQESPATEVLISWGLDENKENDQHLVFISELQHNGADPENSYEFKFRAEESGLASICGEARYSNIQARISGLKPNTTYYYIR